MSDQFSTYDEATQRHILELGCFIYEKSLVHYRENYRHPETNVVTAIEGRILPYEYDKLKLAKDDFMKRKRVKNTVPIQQRCLAKRANGEQCTRKKKEGCDYCGTHTKGVPCSIMDKNDGDAPKMNQESVNIWVQNIKGIEYFIDGSNNVYKHEDVINNSTNPRIIAKYVKPDTGGAHSITFL